MKERPFIFTGNRPKLILDGTKTMARRVIAPQPIERPLVDAYDWWHWIDENGIGHDKHCPYGQVGDRLWCKETTWRGLPISPIYDADLKDAERADYWDMGCRKVPSIFMPKRASRITLEITELKAERLKEITAGDCTEEGILYEDGDYVTMKVFDKFRNLWDSLNAKRGYGWDTNPWVWVISFRVIKGGINADS